MKELINNSYKHSELTGKIIGCTMKVHATLGNGFQEVVYQRSLAVEMERQSLGFARELDDEYLLLRSGRWNPTC